MDNGDDGGDDERDGGDSCWYFNKLKMSSVSLILFKGMMSSRKLLDVCTNKDDDDCVLVDCVLVVKVVVRL
jgi:hypothetical protein